MKKVYLPAIFFLLLFASSCVDIEERYDFKADGSCKVVYGFDMSKAVSVLVNLMSDSVRATPEFSLSKDTTLNFYAALPDSIAAKMNAEEVKMAQGSDLAVHMDLRNSQMKVAVTHEAKDAAELQYYLQHISSIPVKGPSLDFLKEGQRAAKVSGKVQTFTAGQDYYDYEITNHKFYRVVDKIKFNKFLKTAGSKLAMAKAMLIDMPYKVVLNFAKPVKKINNARAIVSADRRRVTLVTTMDEVMKNPSLMNLKIDF